MSNQEIRNYETDVHVYLAFLRKKLNPDAKARCLRRIAKSETDLEILKRECEVIGGHWRVHRTVNKRSTTKALKKLQHHLIDNPECAPYVDSIWKTLLLQPEQRAEKRFMLDIDTMDFDRGVEIMSKIKEPFEILERAETPNGFHVVVPPFDRRCFDGESDVTVLTDGYIYLCDVGKDPVWQTRRNQANG